jgi:NAD(P)-dependent dehydrogenase (short-subunit alcohol dehydrogenase family)
MFEDRFYQNEGLGMSFANKVVLVTGGSSGIGEAAARAFAAAGAKVAIVASSDPAKAAPIVRDIEAAGGRALAFAADVASASAVRQLVADVRAALGEIDILVNAAGVYYATPVGETSEADYDRMADINLKGTFLTINEVAPHMKARKSGKIVNVASVAAVMGVREFSLYCALKAGVAMLTRTLARELAPFDININSVAPGNTATPLNLAYRTDPIYEAYRAGIAAATPSNTLFSAAEDIAGAILFLASDAARAMHGSMLLMDEGVSTGV